MSALLTAESSSAISTLPLWEESNAGQRSIGWRSSATLTPVMSSLIATVAVPSQSPTQRAVVGDAAAVERGTGVAVADGVAVGVSVRATVLVGLLVCVDGTVLLGVTVAVRVAVPIPVGGGVMVTLADGVRVDVSVRASVAVALLD